MISTPPSRTLRFGAVALGQQAGIRLRAFGTSHKSSARTSDTRQTLSEMLPREVGKNERKEDIQITRRSVSNRSFYEWLLKSGGFRKES